MANLVVRYEFANFFFAHQLLLASENSYRLGLNLPNFILPNEI